jgi:hypothetical protein
MRPSAVAEPPMTADGVNATASAFLHDQDPELTKLESCSLSAIKGNGRMFV